MSSAFEPDIAPETVVLRRRPPKTLLEHPPKRTTFYMLLSRRKLTITNVCSHLLWHLRWDSRVCTKPPQNQKVGRRTSAHDLRSPKLSSEQRYMAMNSYVWKMWPYVQQRSFRWNCRYKNGILRQKRPYSRLSSSTDQPVLVL